MFPIRYNALMKLQKVMLTIYMQIVIEFQKLCMACSKKHVKDEKLFPKCLLSWISYLHKQINVYLLNNNTKVMNKLISLYYF
jgi:hypothetical protein